MDDPFFDRTDELDDELAARVKPELQPGERLLWAARSRARSPLGERLPGVSGCLWAAGLFLVCVLLLSPVIANSPRFRHSDEMLAVAGLVSGIIGVLVVIGTISSVLEKGTERQRLKGRINALTDRRAIIWSPVPRSAAVKVDTFPRGSIKVAEVQRVEYPDGSGDVILRKSHEEYGDTVGFSGISDVRRVEELVRRILIEPLREVS